MQKQPSEPSFGADVELFIADENRNIVPCVGLFPGTKRKPYTPKGWDPGFAIQEDNVTLEFNIPATFTWRDAFRAVSTARAYITDLLEEKGLVPVFDASEHLFSATDLTSPQAKTFGCDPDFDAYTGGRVRENVPGFGNNRYCGGHIHIGGNFHCPDFVAALFLELFLSNWTLSLNKNRKNPKQQVSADTYKRLYGQPKPKTIKTKATTVPRTDWYGRPGIFRPKPYGIEYRTPNNRWISSGTDTITAAAFGAATFLSNTQANDLQRMYRQIPWQLLQEAFTEVSGEKQRKVRIAAQKAGVPV